MEELPLAAILREAASRVEETIAGEERMRALLDAVTAISGGLDLQSTLQRVTEAATRPVGARYGALGVLDSSGSGLAQFVTVGIDAQTRSEIGAPPRGLGILGQLIRNPTPLRLADLSAHDSSFGFPENHPQMRTFLGAPIRIGDRVFGNLYLTEKRGGVPFTEEDERAVTALAVAAAVALENAELYERSEQQMRRLRATAQIQQAVLEERPLSEVLQLVADQALNVTRGGAAVVLSRESSGPLVVQAAAGVRDVDVTGLAVPVEGKLAEVVDRGATIFLPEVGDLEGLPLTAAAWLVPFVGQEHSSGVIVVTRSEGMRAVPQDEEIAALRGFANQTSIALRLAAAQADRAALAVAQDRDRIARDLHDVVIQRLFAIGLRLQGLSGRPDAPYSQAQLVDMVEGIDTTILDLRSTIFHLERNEGSTSLRGLISDTIAQAGPELDSRLVMEGPIDLLVPRSVQRELLAVLAEGLSNSARHAKAEHVSVAVHVDAAQLTLTIADDGVGFVPGGRRSGLRNMETRAEALHGECKVDSVPEQGTTVLWTVPLGSAG